MSNTDEKEFDDTPIGNQSNEIRDVHDESKLINKTIWGGVAMLIGGIIWFVVGLSIDMIYFYPLILVIAGIIAIVKGVNDKNRQPKEGNINVIDDNDDLEIL